MGMAGLTGESASVPANRLRLPAPDHALIPFTCPADERGRDVSEYDENGHYRAGPALAQPHGLVTMIAEARSTDAPNMQRLEAEKAIAAERTAMRQALP